MRGTWVAPARLAARITPFAFAGFSRMVWSLKSRKIHCVRAGLNDPIGLFRESLRC